jgi:hypothetical protein
MPAEIDNIPIQSNPVRDCISLHPGRGTSLLFVLQEFSYFSGAQREAWNIAPENQQIANGITAGCGASNNNGEGTSSGSTGEGST